MNSLWLSQSTSQLDRQTTKSVADFLTRQISKEKILGFNYNVALSPFPKYEM
jgi:hypothetical protein